MGIKVNENEPELYIIIATRNRYNDLKRTLNEIAKQTKKPKAVILSDDSDSEQRKKIKKLIEKIKKLNIQMIDGRGIGSAHARNVAIEYILETFSPADDDILLFMDDDVDLPDAKTFEKLVEVFERGNNIVGVGGVDISIRKRPLKCIINQATLALLPKIPVDELYSNSSTTLKRVRRLSGCFMAYKWSAIRDIRFDAQMILYSLGEDLDFSYRIFKTKGTLVATKDIKYIHRTSQSSRLGNTAREIMTLTYLPYITAKNAWHGKIVALIQLIILPLTRIIISLLRKNVCGARRTIRAYLIARGAILWAIAGDLNLANKLIQQYTKEK